ncbi:hypothetical protein MRX96_014350 [Rhipicephalus microplus]
MPHGSGGDDLASSDEIKVFKDEGEEEKRSSENLTDLKSSLVTEGEEEKIVGLPGQATSGYASPKPTRSDAFGSLFGKSSFEPIPGPFGYVVPPYHNGALGAAVSMATLSPVSVVLVFLFRPLFATTGVLSTPALGEQVNDSDERSPKDFRWRVKRHSCRQAAVSLFFWGGEKEATGWCFVCLVDHRARVSPEAAA